MFFGEEIVGSIRLCHKSHVLKVIFFCFLLSCPDPANNLEGETEIYVVNFRRNEGGADDDRVA